MEVSLPEANFGEQIAAALATLQGVMDKILTQKKPFVLPASKLAGVVEKIEALKKLHSETPSFLKTAYFSNEFDDAFPNEKAGEDWSIDRLETFGLSVLAAQCGSWKPTVGWRGQFLIRANPATQALEFDLYRYSPSRVPADVKLAAMRLGSEANTATGRFIFEEMERFEVSRVLQMRFPYESITRVGLLEAPIEKEAEDESQRQEAVLVVEVGETPLFFTKRINTQASMMNAWRPRADFSTDSQASKSGRFAFLANANGLREFMAFLLAQCPKAIVDSHAAELVELSQSLPFSDAAQKRAATASTSSTAFRQTLKTNIDEQAEKDKLKAPEQALLDLLVENALLDPADVKSERSQSALAHSFGNCFYDYITFHVADAAALKAVFASDLTSGASGILDVDEFGGETVLHFLKHQKKNSGDNSSGNASAGQFYSFCQKQILEKEDHNHCQSCKSCRNHNFWHCPSCNKCSDGEEAKKHCEHCGVRMGAADAHFATINKELKPKPLPLSRRLDKSGPQYLMEDDADEEGLLEEDLLVISDDSDDDQPVFAPEQPAGDDDDDLPFLVGDDEGEDNEDEDEEAAPRGKKAPPTKKVSFFEDVEAIDDDDDDDEEEEEEEGPFASRKGTSKKKPAKKSAAKSAPRNVEPKSSGFNFGQAPTPSSTPVSGGFAKSAFGFDIPPAGFQFTTQAPINVQPKAPASHPKGSNLGGKGRGPRGRL